MVYLTDVSGRHRSTKMNLHVLYLAPKRRWFWFLRMSQAGTLRVGYLIGHVRHLCRSASGGV